MELAFFSLAVQVAVLSPVRILSCPIPPRLPTLQPVQVTPTGCVKQVQLKTFPFFFYSASSHCSLLFPTPFPHRLEGRTAMPLPWAFPNATLVWLREEVQDNRLLLSGGDCDKVGCSIVPHCVPLPRLAHQLMAFIPHASQGCPFLPLSPLGLKLPCSSQYLGLQGSPPPPFPESLLPVFPLPPCSNVTCGGCCRSGGLIHTPTQASALHSHPKTACDQLISVPGGGAGVAAARSAPLAVCPQC